MPLVGPAAKAVERFRCHSTRCTSTRASPLFPGGSDPGATALKQTVSALLGLRIDYYAFVDLDGFVRMVDALGGVTIRVKERLVDEVTRPAWGDEAADRRPAWPHVPLRRPHRTGVRALAEGVQRLPPDEPATVLRARSPVRSTPDRASPLRVADRDRPRRSALDIPLRSLPDLVRLAAAVDPSLTVTESFGASYIKARRSSDGYPVPAIGRIRATARDAILLEPGELEQRRGIATAARSC